MVNGAHYLSQFCQLSDSFSIMNPMQCMSFQVISCLTNSGNVNYTASRKPPHSLKTTLVGGWTIISPRFRVKIKSIRVRTTQNVKGDNFARSCCSATLSSICLLTLITHHLAGSTKPEISLDWDVLGGSDAFFWQTPTQTWWRLKRGGPQTTRATNTWGLKKQTSTTISVRLPYARLSSSFKNQSNIKNMMKFLQQKLPLRLANFKQITFKSMFKVQFDG